MFAALLVTLAAAPAAIDFDYRSGSGFTASLDGVPLIQGSFFQYYEAGWTRGYYSSNWNPQTVTRVDDELQVTFESTDKRASGTLTFARSEDTVRARRTFRWTVPRGVKIEDTIGMLWAPALAAGTVQVDGGRPRSLAAPPKVGSGLEERQLGEGSHWVFDSPFARIEIEATGGQAVLIDGRGFDSEWSLGRELLWLGFRDVDVTQEQPVELGFTLRVTRRAAPTVGQNVRTLPLGTSELAQAHGPFEAPLPLIPQVKSWKPVASGATVGLPASVGEGPEWVMDALRKGVVRAHRLDAWPTSGPPLQVRLGVGPKGAESYALEVSPAQIQIDAEDEAGLRHAVRTLAQMVRADGGQARLPQGRLEDWPSISWRGIHMFVGPAARTFQRRLTDHLLGPLRFNQVVLECSRTDWNATPGIETSITMSRDELAQLFGQYREAGIEPSPLIQSFGHMGWLFANGQNRDAMFNPEVPFSIDPRKPRTREVLGAIWDEAIDLLKPKMVHFGLDEVDMRGWPDDPKLVTELWRLHVPWLASLAKRHGVEMMLWGDIALGPGEAPDAMHGHTLVDAQARRDVIPDGAWVADWHYKNDPRPEIFTSLELWKREGQRPVAATWFRPNNIYGFFHAAGRAGAGVLHTTWAGYESNERHMMVSDDQFASYVLAGEYSWSLRPELPNALPYKPEDVLRRWYFEPPRPLAPVSGRSFGGERPATIGDVRFLLFEPIGLRWPLSEAGAREPLSVEVPLSGWAREVALGLDVRAQAQDAEEVGEVQIRLEDGRVITEKLVYGWHVRVPGDGRGLLLAARSHGVSAVRVRLPETARLERLVVRAAGPAHGLRLHGVTAF